MRASQKQWLAKFLVGTSAISLMGAAQTAMAQEAPADVAGARASPGTRRQRRGCARTATRTRPRAGADIRIRRAARDAGRRRFRSVPATPTARACVRCSTATGERVPTRRSPADRACPRSRSTRPTVRTRSPARHGEGSTTARRSSRGDARRALRGPRPLRSGRADTASSSRRMPARPGNRFSVATAPRRLVTSPYSSRIRTSSGSAPARPACATA